MRNILLLEEKLKIRLITGDFELLSFLYFYGKTKSRDLAMNTRTSIANFQIILRRLKADGLIVAINDDTDRRIRVYDLAEHIRSDFDKIFSKDSEGYSIISAVAEKVQENSRAESAISTVDIRAYG